MSAVQLTNAGDAPEGAAYSGRPELAIAALLHMMTRFPARRSPAMAEAIVRHLRVVAEDERLAPELRECALVLMDDWCAVGALVQPGAWPAWRLS